MNPLLFNKNFDLVDFDGLKLFMLEHDNLYKTSVAESRKYQDLNVYQRATLVQGPPASPVTPANANDLTSARYGIFLVMAHLWKHDLDFVVLDIGSYIGDWGIKVGNFIRTFGRTTKVITFDPSEAGALVEYNIELNKLEKIVRHEMLAVSDFNGVVMFRYQAGGVDAGEIAETRPNAITLAATWLKRFGQLPFWERIKAYCLFAVAGLKRLIRFRFENVEGHTLLVRCVDIPSYLETNRIDGSVFAKIDIEGHDSQVISRLVSIMAKRKVYVVFEFAPIRFASQQEAVAYLKTHVENFFIFDLFYCPNPTRINHITPDNLPAFVADVSQRALKYTDIFLLDKRTPACEELMRRLSKLKPEPDAVIL